MIWTVKETIIEAKLTKTIRFTAESFVDFKAGQFFMLVADVDGKKVRRAYSISSSPDEKSYTITVKLTPNPTFSKYLHQIEVGATIEAEGPFGKFCFEGARDIVLIGAGSGVAPLFSIAKYVSDVKIVWLDSHKTEDEIIFKKQLDELNNTDNFELHRTLTQQDGAEFSGRVNEEIIKKIILDFSKPTFFICGSSPFVKSVVLILEKLGVDTVKIKKEQY